VLLVEAVHPGVARRVVRRERATVGPRGAALERHDPRGGTVEHRPVVRHEQHGAPFGADRVLEPLLALDVERVVRLVEQQHLERRREDHLDREALALPAGQRLDEPIAALGIAAAEGPVRARVPDHLGLVPARGLPRAERVRVGELRLLVRVARRQPLLDRAHACGRLPDRTFAVREQEVPHRRRTFVRPDELPHQPHPTVDPHGTRGGLLLAGEQLQQGRLADPVRADERRVLTVRHAERHPLEQRPATGEGVRHVGEFDEAHGRSG
jgi:hypothetical protein